MKNIILNFGVQVHELNEILNRFFRNNVTFFKEPLKSL